MEAVFSIISSNWEDSGKVESDIPVSSSSTEFPIGHLKHIINLLLTITFTRFLLHGLLELEELINNVFLEVSGLNVDRGLL
jgi:hypothetical protein